MPENRKYFANPPSRIRIQPIEIIRCGKNSTTSTFQKNGARFGGVSPDVAGFREANPRSRANNTVLLITARIEEGLPIVASLCISHYRALCDKARKVFEAWKLGDLSESIPSGLFAPRVPSLVSVFQLHL